MKLLIVSDNHGNAETLKNILENETHDKAIHLGDAGASKEWLKDHFDYAVCGNHDFWEPLEIYFNFGGIRILALHGHTRGISVFGTEKKVKQILSHEDVDLLLHGHTHIFSFGRIDGKNWICPGSTNLSRGPEGNGYVILEVENKKIKCVNFKEIK